MKKLEKYRHQIRLEQIDFALYLIIQVVKIVPVSLLFQTKYKLSDLMVAEEISIMELRYLKKQNKS